MADESRPGAPDPEGLDLDRADFSSEGPPVCSLCSTPITHTYFTVGQQLLCASCSERLRTEGPDGSPLTRSLTAAGFGLVAAAAGSVLWLVVTEVTGYEIGLIAIAVGMLVGGAVQRGSRHIGGTFYQLLAVGLTYTAIVMTYVPAIATSFENSAEFRQGFESTASRSPAEVSPGSEEMPDVIGEAPIQADSRVETQPARVRVAAWLVAIPIAFVAPFLMGFENAIGILIIGFALWQAWSMNRRRELPLSGPFEMGAARSTPTPFPLD